ncbi:YrdB family protein [Streptomyces sp. NPDC020719]|uniref:YrdB family protein n=1 Tax=unclassified Streptomyces TaxID=2593676 RepID=UPI0033CB8F13
MLPRPLHVLNEGAAFLLELCALAVLAWWGYRTGENTAVRLLLAVAAPGSAAVVWGLFAAPKARIRVPLAGVLTVKALVFGAAVAALYAVGHHALALAFAIVAVVNTTAATLDRRALMHRGR